MIASYVIGFFAFLSLGVGLLVVNMRVRVYLSGIKTTGVVVRVTTRTQHRPDGGPVSLRGLVVKVTDPSSGEDFTFEPSLKTSWRPLVIGKTVPVRFIPGHASSAEIDHPLDIWFFPVGCLSLGGLLTAVLLYPGTKFGF